MLDLNAGDIGKCGETISHTAGIPRCQAGEVKAVLENAAMTCVFVMAQRAVYVCGDIQRRQGGHGDDMAEVAGQFGRHQVIGFGKKGARVQVSSP